MKHYPPLTIALIVVCVAVWWLGEESGLHQYLYIAYSERGLGEVANGQWWRLITPIFIHYGIMHLLFNMLWLWDLGGAIESRKRPWFLAAFMLVAGIAGNLAQYYFTSHLFFGGMSGVVYGLLGYIWMQSIFNPAAGFTLHQSTVVMMLIWFVVCWTGLLGPIGNWAHAAGLLIGVAWGYLAANIGRRRKNHD
jgi:GlpG protein